MVKGIKRGVSGASRGNSAIFELQTPDFKWKFAWNVPTNYQKKSQGHRKGGSAVAYTRFFVWGRH